MKNRQSSRRSLEVDSISRGWSDLRTFEGMQVWTSRTATCGRQCCCFFEAGIWCGAGAPEITFDHWSDFAFDAYPSDSRIPIRSWVHMMHIDAQHLTPRQVLQKDWWIQERCTEVAHSTSLLGPRVCCIGLPIHSRHSSLHSVLFMEQHGSTLIPLKLAGLISSLIVCVFLGWLLLYLGSLCPI